MTRTRWTALATVVGVIAVAAVAVALTSGHGGRPSGSTASANGGAVLSGGDTSSTDGPGSSTSSTAATSTTAKHVSDPNLLHMGSSGPKVRDVQQRLSDLHFDPGPVNGSFGQATAYAVEGFQSMTGMPEDGVAGPAVQAALASAQAPTPLVPNGGPDRVEVDLTRQLLFVYKSNALRLVTHVSTGSGQRYCVDGDCERAITPVGAFRFSWRASGWHESRLGKLYNPVFFTSTGIAVHGALSVPTSPASHGCVRIPMHIAEYFPSLVARGDVVYVVTGPSSMTPPPNPANPGPAPVAPPSTPDEPTTTTTSRSTSTTGSTTSTTSGSTSSSTSTSSTTVTTPSTTTP